MIDTNTSKFLLPTTFTSNAGQLWLYRCAMDFSSCSFLDISMSLGQDSGYYPQLVIDPTRLKIIVRTGSAALVRCNLDGTACLANLDICSTSPFAGSCASWQRALIDVPRDRLLVHVVSTVMSGDNVMVECSLSDITICSAALIPTSPSKLNLGSRQRIALSPTTGNLLVAASVAAYDNRLALYDCVGRSTGPSSGWRCKELNATGEAAVAAHQAVGVFINDEVVMASRDLSNGGRPSLFFLRSCGSGCVSCTAQQVCTACEGGLELDSTTGSACVVDPRANLRTRCSAASLAASMPPDAQASPECNVTAEASVNTSCTLRCKPGFHVPPGLELIAVCLESPGGGNWTVLGERRCVPDKKRRNLTDGSTSRAASSLAISAYLVAAMMFWLLIAAVRVRRTNLRRRDSPGEFREVTVDQAVLCMHSLLGLFWLASEMDALGRSSRMLVLALQTAIQLVCICLLPLLNPNAYESDQFELQRLYDTILAIVVSFFVGLLLFKPALQKALKSDRLCMRAAGTIASFACIGLALTVSIVILAQWSRAASLSSLASMFASSLFASHVLSEPLAIVARFFVLNDRFVALRVDKQIHPE